MKASLHILASFFVDKYYCQLHGLPWWLSGKEYACNAGDQGSISGSGRSPGEENGNPLQYSCLGNPMDRGAWWATIHGVAEELDTLSDFTTSTTIYVFMYVCIYIYLQPTFHHGFLMHFNTNCLHRPFLQDKVNGDADDGFSALILRTNTLAA